MAIWPEQYVKWLCARARTAPIRWFRNTLYNKLTKENPVRNQPYISTIKCYDAKTSQIVVSISFPTKDYKLTANDKTYFFYFKTMTPNNFPNNYWKITLSIHIKIFEISSEQFNSVGRYWVILMDGATLSPARPGPHQILNKISND